MNYLLLVVEVDEYKVVVVVDFGLLLMSMEHKNK
jgi:hypothetical protein